MAALQYKERFHRKYIAGNCTCTENIIYDMKIHQFFPWFAKRQLFPYRDVGTSKQQRTGCLTVDN